MKIGKAPHRLVTYALGSCLGIAVFDPESKVGGLLHVMVPSSSVSPERALEKPYMFVDLGVPMFFRACFQAGVVRERIIVKVAGGSNPQGANGAPDYFRIGERNFTALKRLLWKNGILIHASEVGGHISRTMVFDLSSGGIQIKTGDEARKL